MNNSDQAKKLLIFSPFDVFRASDMRPDGYFYPYSESKHITRTKLWAMFIFSHFFSLVFVVAYVLR